MSLSFSKMHGIGNDYIYLNCLKETLDNIPEAAKKLSDRHFGVGGDGLVLILPSQEADFRMRMFNADGSEAEMCGNAIRCVGKYLFDRKLTDKTTLDIETASGIKQLELTVTDGVVSLVRVNMGRPCLTAGEIPVNAEISPVVNADLSIQQQVLKMTCVSMGNPHAVFFTDQITDRQIFELGPVIEVNPAFPKRINVEFVKVLSRSELQMRVWERGTGETLACGTGACAVAVAAALNSLSDRSVTVHLLGGDLQIEWAEDDFVYMAGPAEFVFDGVI